MDKIALLYRCPENQNDYETRFPSDKIKGNRSVIKFLFFDSYGDFNWNLQAGFLSAGDAICRVKLGFIWPVLNHFAVADVETKYTYDLKASINLTL